MTAEERAIEIVAKHWHLLQGTRARAKAALVAEIATEINAGQMDQAVTHAKAALEECIELRTEVERLTKLNKELVKHDGNAEAVCNSYAIENQQFHDKIERLNEECVASMSEIAIGRAEVERLRTFAKWVEDHSNEPGVVLKAAAILKP